MPLNLNALIRYAQIDKNIRNPYVASTIERLRIVCSDALTEYKGRDGMVSERTIRDDIRVMRSELLGFNAPIVFEEGKYIYSEDNYAIFDISISEIFLLREVFYTLINNKNEIKKEEQVDDLLAKISPIIGENYESKRMKKEKLNKVNRQAKNKSKGGISYSIRPEYSSRNKMYMKLNWSDIFNCL